MPYRFYERCKHRRKRAKSVLFSSAALQSPGVLKVHTERQQQQKQRAEQEQQRLAAGLPFDYEPHSFGWCAAYTDLESVEKAQAGDMALLESLLESGAAVANPVTGQISLVYALCAQKNPRGTWERYEPA